MASRVLSKIIWFVAPWHPPRGFFVPMNIKETALDLLRDCFEDEIAMLELRMIRDAQSPRFEELKETHPEIWEDFMRARTGPHEV